MKMRQASTKTTRKVEYTTIAAALAAIAAAAIVGALRERFKVFLSPDEMDYLYLGLEGLAVYLISKAVGYNTRPALRDGIEVER